MKQMGDEAAVSAAQVQFLSLHTIGLITFIFHQVFQIIRSTYIITFPASE
jgi:hypothetical protein